MSLSAGVPLTMKSVGWTLLGSVGSLRLTEKSTGGVLITLPQSGLLMYKKQTEGVGVGLGGTVAVGVTVAVAVGVALTVAVAVGVGDGPLPPQMIISLSVQTAVCPARACGTFIVPVAFQLFVLGLYLPPEFR